MAISKVTLNGVTQMDVTGDTVVANHLLDGDTATGANGVQLTGTLQVDLVVDPTLSIEGDAADAKATGDAIAESNTALDYHKKGQTLIFGYDIIENSYPAANGTFPSYNDWNRTDYIEITGGQRVYFYGTTVSTSDNAWYNSSKQVINKFTIAAGDLTTVVAPDNAKYMVVSTRPARWWPAICTDQTYYADNTRVLRNINPFENVVSANNNYLDADDLNIENSYFGTNGAITSSNNYICGYIQIPKPGNYKVQSTSDSMGSARTNIYLFDANKNYYKTLTATADDSYIVSFTISENDFVSAVYVGVNKGVYDANYPMLILDASYPADRVYQAPFYVLKNTHGSSGLPEPPSANGTYTLRCVVSSGTPTYSWVTV